MAKYQLKVKDNKVLLMRGNAVYAEVTHQVDANTADLVTVEAVDESDHKKQVTLRFLLGDSTREATITKGSFQTEETSNETTQTSQAPTEESNEQDSQGDETPEETPEVPDEAPSDNHNEEESTHEEVKKPTVDIAAIRAARSRSTAATRGDLSIVAQRRMSKADKLAKWINERRNVKVTKQ